MLSSIASIWMAVIATIALRTWSKTVNAQKQIEFLDRLIETLHEYIQAMVIPIKIWEFSKLGINTYTEIQKRHEFHFPIDGIIDYVTKHGKENQARLNDYLDKVRPIRSRLDALAAKGQIFEFNNYTQCFDACKMISWSFGQLEACVLLLGSYDLNWQNKFVQEKMNKIASIDPEDIRRNIQTQNTILLEFARDAYVEIIGRKPRYLPITHGYLLRSKAWFDKLLNRHG